MGMDLNVALVTRISCEFTVCAMNSHTHKYDFSNYFSSFLFVVAFFCCFLPMGVAMPGGRYCSADHSDEFQTIMNNEFSYDVTVTAFDISIELRSPSYQVRKIHRKWKTSQEKKHFFFFLLLSYFFFLRLSRATVLPKCATSRPARPFTSARNFPVFRAMRRTLPKVCGLPNVKIYSNTFSF